MAPKTGRQPRCERCGAVVVFPGLCAECRALEALDPIDRLIAVADPVDVRLAAQATHALLVTYGLGEDDLRAVLVGASMVEWLADRARGTQGMDDARVEDVIAGSRLAVRTVATVIAEIERRKEHNDGQRVPTGNA